MRRAQVITILPMVVLLVLEACAPTAAPELPSTTVPATPQSAILGKWRHGLPEECPTSMDPRQYEELKKLTENETYYLEFLNNGKVLYICEGQILDGTYTLISDNYVEITWNVLVGTLAWELFGGHGVYKVEFSGNKMTLQGGRGLNATY